MRVLFSLALLLLAGCADLGYYWHSTTGHLALMNARVDIGDLLQQPELDSSLRERLLRVNEIRAYSVARLALPASGSYSSYVQLDRPYVLQNLFAAREFSTELHRWCYPIVGCASYRGYYDSELLNEYVARLEREQFEIHVGYVPAYSTLGWFDDPVLSSFIDWPDYRLAGLLFHELTHQRIYINDDTEFNESLAVAVQLAGTGLWLESRNDHAQLDEFNRWVEYRSAVVLLVESMREDLRLLYEIEADEAMLRSRKQVVFSRGRDRYAHITERLNYRDGFADWFAAPLNNAKIGSVSAYNTHVPAFLALLASFEYDFSAFFDQVEAIGDLDKLVRDQCLAAWAVSAPGEMRPCAGYF